MKPRLAAAVALAMSVPSITTPSALAQGHDHHHGHGPESAAAGEWRMVPMPPDMFMLPGIEAEVPRVAPFLPGADLDPVSVPESTFRTVVRVQDGDTVALEAGFVRRTIDGHEFIAYGFNGQHPGPLIQVEQGATIVVRFINGTDWPNAIHWHGKRVGNPFDGVPGVTQAAVMPGEDFVYEVTLPDAGIYWYHPHDRTDVTLGLGLFGNLLVTSPDPDYYGPANRDELLMLHDLLMDRLGLFPYGREGPTHALTGRFGNVLLVNGERGYELEVDRGEVVRFHLTNAANARTFNIHFGESVPLKLVASDVGRFEREQWIESVVIAPGERYVVEARFAEPGPVALVNDIQALDHMQGRFERQVDTLGVVNVAGRRAERDLGESHERLRRNADVSADFDALRHLFDRPAERSLTLRARPGQLPVPVANFIQIDTIYFPPVEWNDAMPEMNWLATSENLTWILRDDATGRENMDIDWRFRQGDVFKLRLFNDPQSFHPMHHPIHLHGQRFLVLSVDGVRRSNLVWKDTVLVPTGSEVELLVEVSNPGIWMLHCHILEHAGSGMMMTVTVEEADAP